MLKNDLSKPLICFFETLKTINTKVVLGQTHPLIEILDANIPCFKNQI
jgi:hypothetical protein